MNAQVADEHVFVDSTVVKKAAPTNKDPNDIKMKFPPSIEAKDLILKPIDDEQESHNDTDSSTSNQSPLFSSPMLPEKDVFNPTDDNHIDNNDRFNDHIIFNNLTQDNEINPFPFNIPLNALNALELYAAASAIDLQQTWASEDLINPQTWSSPELSTSNSFSPEINEFNDFNEIGEINESYPPHIIHNDFFNYDETINQNIFEIDTNTCINYNNEINSNNPLWFQPGNLPLGLTEESNNNSSFYL
ncbi:9578_t:CDS:2 [Dentiscutata heterogama]|uniref:9578_t:CDS:1 n=1 Tax=Dentiscutata heterogama TaxID=1316150 RepID=A0ACA9K3H9_9GLOM|nr:9578_t:CDS:2 [Dentiscutata heterogama]